MSAVDTQPTERARDASPGRAARVSGGPAGCELRLMFRPSSPRSRVVMILIELFIGVPAIPAGVGLIRNGLGLPVAIWTYDDGGAPGPSTVASRW